MKHHGKIDFAVHISCPQALSALVHLCSFVLTYTNVAPGSSANDSLAGAYCHLSCQKETGDLLDELAGTPNVDLGERNRSLISAHEPRA